MPGISLRIAGVAAVVAMMSSCAQTGAPLPPSLELPEPVNDLRAVRKADRVYLSWTVPVKTTDGAPIHLPGPTRICRSLQSQFENCVSPVGQEPPPPPLSNQGLNASVAAKPANFTDTLSPDLITQSPTGVAYYAVTVLNSHGRSAGLSNQVQVPLLPVLPPPQNFRAGVTPLGVNISWQCEASPTGSLPIHYRTRIYRRVAGSSQTVMASETDAATCPGSYLDESFEWEQTYEYWGTTVTLRSEAGGPVAEVEGENTESVRLPVHDTFPPSVPTGLQAVFSGPGQQRFIDLTWSPGADSDLAGYNVYRREAGGAASRINAQAVKTPAFRDTQVLSGQHYFYSVSAVDVRGNESARSPEAAEDVP